MLIIKNGTLLPKGHGGLIDRSMLPTDYITDDDISDASAIVEADKEDKIMPKEEAIARIMNHKIVHKMNEPEAIYISKALDMAIEELKQEPCEDAVSRQSINKLQKYEYRCGDATIICVSLTSINKLPPVKLDERTWVPVSEDLPKEKETVTASTKYAVYPEARYTKEDGWEWAYESGADYWVELEDVEAWMPLPKRYIRKDKS